MTNKKTITARFWSKYLGQYSISQSYVYIANVVALGLGLSVVSIIWCIILTILITK